MKGNKEKMELNFIFLYNRRKGMKYMLVFEQLKNNENLSNNEREVADYLLNYKGDLGKLSTSDIAKQTYTSPSTTIRLAKKMGYDGWNQLKEAICVEKEYLEKQSNEVDANYPFNRQDTIQQIVVKIEKLNSEAIHETARMIDHDELQRAVEYLYKAKEIYIFAMANSATTAYDFQYKMRFLFKKVTILNNRDDFAFTFKTINKEDCCIFISYSGQTFDDLGMSSVLKNRICPCISITAYHENKLLSCVDAHLFVSDQENRYAKIGHFVSNESIHYILDILYACIFNHNYHQSIDARKDYIERVDHTKS